MAYASRHFKATKRINGLCEDQSFAHPLCTFLADNGYTKNEALPIKFQPDFGKLVAAALV